MSYRDDAPWLQRPHLLPGQPEPLGSLATQGGVNVAVCSAQAQRMLLCVFSADGQRELARLALHGPHAGVFHGFLPGAPVGMVYGFRAEGPWAPERGQCCNPAKLLLDPWGREILPPAGGFRWQDLHAAGQPQSPLQRDERDNAAAAHKSRVALPPRTAAAHLNRPRIAEQDRVFYEVHVKGFSAQHPGIPEALRGTYSGLAHPSSVAHFKSLGVTTLSLLPIQHALSEPHLQALGLTNYWGYNTLGFFSPDPRWSSTPDDPRATAQEFHRMVASLHAAGLEVVLDVVYNHTPEGGRDGASLCWRGLDEATWYHRHAQDPRQLANLSGCGNALNVAHPLVTRFVLDSLRYWVQEMGVDGFRFDLAPILGRDAAQQYRADAAFFTALRQDPLLREVMLIAEPWDAGPNGYQMGQFPPPFAEWNDKFRDTVRGWWLGRGVNRGQLAQRFCASSTSFAPSGRLPAASVNFIAVHDGFTTADVVRYSGKHNQANGEHNRDGRDDELCHNFGIEGPTDDAAVAEARRRTQRALLATLLLAHGSPMLCAGDEIGRSQQGNNNAYNQDNALTWLDWAQADADLLRFVRRTLALRHSTPVWRHNRWPVPWHAHAKPAEPSGSACRVRWLDAASHELGLQAWHHSADAPDAAFAGHYLWGAAMGDGPTEAWLVCFNPCSQAQAFALPDTAAWRVALDSAGLLDDPHQVSTHRESLLLPAHSLVVAQRVDPPAPGSQL